MSNYKNPVCRGSFMLGTACGKCERCLEQKENMSQFKNIRKLGLSITTWGGDPRTSAVIAQELETLLQSAQVVYGLKEVTSNAWCWFDKASQTGLDTHTAILLAITPIKKQTKAEAAFELLQEMLDDVNFDWQGSEHHFEDEAKRILNMKV